MPEILPTRALSLTGPWWWLMICLPEPWRKCVENRSPGFSHKSFRGPVWVHATTERSEETYYSAIAFAQAAGVPETELEKMPALNDMPRGGIVGRFTITRRLAVPGFDLFTEELPPTIERWRMANNFGFLTVDAKTAPYTPCRGYQGFWGVPPSVLEQLGGAP